MTAEEESAEMSDGVTLELDNEHASWLSRHLEEFIANQPVNTEPEAHHIVSKLHQHAD